MPRYTVYNVYKPGKNLDTCDGEQNIQSQPKVKGSHPGFNMLLLPEITMITACIPINTIFFILFNLMLLVHNVIQTNIDLHWHPLFES